MRNKFCDASDFSNEASVESFFIMRLLEDLGYKDSEIRPKQSIQELRVPRGCEQELFKPDYLLVCSRFPRWLIDAKAPTERVDDFTYQCAGYALQINRKYTDRPCQYFMLTNGLLTRVYVWDQDEPILSLRFADFVAGNTKYEALKRLLGADSARRGWSTDRPRSGHQIKRPAMDVVKAAFLRCHRIIWKSEKMSPQAAFVAFAKLLFVKLWEDRRLRDDPEMLEAIGTNQPLPLSAVRFSTHWITQQEKNDPNPVDSILFRQLVEQIEREIAQRRRKRIFAADERLALSPGTIKRVVEVLEHFYLFGIDEDLNGRMFEAFLVATMRGQALGQYFTPRSIVKLITRLAEPKASREGVERVLDACCGTGGFLIEVLTEMRRQVYDNRSLSLTERNALLNEVANEAIFGIDAGREPPVARIARINMYLHGDGGSRVYTTDALRDPPQHSGADTLEIQAEVTELRGLLEAGTLFDVVMTNPPFSMDYSVNVPEEAEVLRAYDLANYRGRARKSLRSSVMFVERYWHLLRPGGRLLTVIDDSVLGGRNFADVRDYIREKFTIRAVISLHGDAFQRAGARTKTSILYLVKRHTNVVEQQPAAFVYESRYIGLDDVVQKTRLSVAERARMQAMEEMAEIQDKFKRFLAGENGPWLVPPERLTGRLDAKFLLPWSVAKLEPVWIAQGARVEVLENLVDPVETLVPVEPDALYQFLKISYEGRAERGDSALGREISYPKVGTMAAGDIVLSNINAVHRAICVLPAGMDDLVVSNEFTVLRKKPSADIDPAYLWSVLRSTAVVAEWITGSSGMGRHRVDWDVLRYQKVPLLSPDRQRQIGNLIREAEEHEVKKAKCIQSAQGGLAGLDLEGETAKERLVRARPPR